MAVILMNVNIVIFVSVVMSVILVIVVILLLWLMLLTDISDFAACDFHVLTHVENDIPSLFYLVSMLFAGYAATHCPDPTKKRQKTKIPCAGPPTRNALFSET